MIGFLVYLLLFSMSLGFAPGLQQPKWGRLLPLQPRGIMQVSSNVATNTNEKADNDDKDVMEKATVHKVCDPSGNCKVTLIGTAHLSKHSSEQVDRIIKTVQPDVVAVELDEKRLKRIGFSSIRDLGIEEVVTAADIQIPDDHDDEMENVTIWKYPQTIFNDWGLWIVSQLARRLLTGMYNSASKGVGNEAGAEFIAAIEACKKYGITRLVLADQESFKTIQRTAKLAFATGDFAGFVTRLERANEEEMEKFGEAVLNDLPDRNDEAAALVAMMEALKADTNFRMRLFDRLEQEVPEFTTAFVKERDYIMSEAIRRELERGANHVVGVVGLAHVNGIKKNLEEMLAEMG